MNYVKSGDRISNKLGVEPRKKKMNISNLRCINLDGLIYMLTSANTCTHVCELAHKTAACCLFMRALLRSLTAARQCVQ